MALHPVNIGVMCLYRLREKVTHKFKETRKLLLPLFSSNVHNLLCICSVGCKHFKSWVLGQDGHSDMLADLALHSYGGGGMENTNSENTRFSEELTVTSIFNSESSPVAMEMRPRLWPGSGSLVSSVSFRKWLQNLVTERFNIIISAPVYELTARVIQHQTRANRCVDHVLLLRSELCLILPPILQTLLWYQLRC